MTRVLVVGDLMLDETLNGPVRDRAHDDMPVVTVAERHLEAGGAARAAQWVERLGAEPRLVGTIGNDGSGAALRTLLGPLALHVVTDDGPTTHKCTVRVDGVSRIRLDTENRGRTTREPDLIASMHALALDAVAILIADYDKGLITSALMTVARHRGLPLVLDPSGRRCLPGASAITPNRHEARTLTGEADPRAALDALAAENPHTLVCITLDVDGVLVRHVDGTTEHTPAIAVCLRRTVGAGDAFAAGLAVGLGRGLPARDCVHFALIAAAAACEER